MCDPSAALYTTNKAFKATVIKIWINSCLERMHLLNYVVSIVIRLYDVMEVALIEITLATVVTDFIYSYSIPL